MKLLNIFSLNGAVAFVFLSFAFCGSKVIKNEPKSSNGFAIVELFTSEGCSGCPAADEAMIKLAKEFPEHVYFLGYHVDYWNYIGWKDEFSDAEYTKRQNRYAEVFGLNSIYTPQAVINGEKEIIGSKESQLRSIIKEQLQAEPSSSSIELKVKNDGADNLVISYKLTNPGKAVLNIALIQNMATTNVKRGENYGRKLSHINIVRNLKTISVIKGTGSELIFKTPPGLATKDLKVIAFAQNENDMKITAAAESMIQ